MNFPVSFAKVNCDAWQHFSRFFGSVVQSILFFFSLSLCYRRIGQAVHAFSCASIELWMHLGSIWRARRNSITSSFIRSKFSSTFSVNTVISESDQLVLCGDLCFPYCICDYLRHCGNIGRHIGNHHSANSRKFAVLWDTNRRLAKLIGD